MPGASCSAICGTYATLSPALVVTDPESASSSDSSTLNSEVLPLPFGPTSPIPGLLADLDADLAEYLDVAVEEPEL